MTSHDQLSKTPSSCFYFELLVLLGVFLYSHEQLEFYIPVSVTFEMSLKYFMLSIHTLAKRDNNVPEGACWKREYLNDNSNTNEKKHQSLCSEGVLFYRRITSYSFVSRVHLPRGHTSIGLPVRERRGLQQLLFVPVMCIPDAKQNFFSCSALVNFLDGVCSLAPTQLWQGSYFLVVLLLPPRALLYLLDNLIRTTRELPLVARQWLKI